MGNKSKGYTFRRFINDIHLWLGVASSAVLFLVCLSGTVLVFRPEIEQKLEPEKYYLEEVLPVRKSYTDIIKFVEKQTGGKVTRLSYYDDLHKPYEVQVLISEEDKRGETYYINQYTKTILGTNKGKGTSFFMFFFKLHRWLLLEEGTGRFIVGTATLIFIILAFTGIILWFPKKIKGIKSFTQGLTIKFGSNWKRINHDLHNALGFYAFPLILIMALTGLNWSFEWYKDSVSDILEAKVFAGRDEKPIESEGSGSLLPLAEIIRKGDSVYPYRGKTIIVLPREKNGSYTISKQNVGRFNRDATDKVTLDSYTGKVLKKEVFSHKPTGQKIAAQIKATHIGDIYGTLSKSLYFIACLIATSLPVTGIFIWINKMKKPKKNGAA